MNIYFLLDPVVAHQTLNAKDISYREEKKSIPRLNSVHTHRELHI